MQRVGNDKKQRIEAIRFANSELRGLDTVRLRAQAREISELETLGGNSWDNCFTLIRQIAANTGLRFASRLAIEWVCSEE